MKCWPRFTDSPSSQCGFASRAHIPAVVIAAASLLSTALPAAEVVRALPAGERPADRRLEPLKDLDGYFPFTPPASSEQWGQRRERVQRQVQIALGLWPLPSRTPLNAVVHGRVDREDYTVERAYFESIPGFYVTGSLYRPKAGSGKRAGVLCPHGHWADGRFHDAGAEQVRKEIAAGAEQFEEGGRSPLQARCVQLARMGCVVFHYDMIGYADSVQIPFEIAHRFAKQRPEMNTVENWGLFSPQAESHLQSVMGLQTFNSIRALDFLTSLPDVDPERIGVTGASGGGTQTFILSAIDPRPTTAFPAVMVSTAMQGGCTCENACCLRVGTGNVEIAALFAPKPLGLTAADDWTKEMETKGFPQLQTLYGTLGAPDDVMLTAALQFGHNYNLVSRKAMYGWFNRHLKLGQPEPIEERDYQRLTTAEMSVWDEQHPRPEGGVDFERKLLRWWTEDSARQLVAYVPGDESSLETFRKGLGNILQVVLGGAVPDASDVEFSEKGRSDGGNWERIVGLLRNTSAGAELPLLILRPRSATGRVVIWLHPEGKAGLLKGDGTPNDDVQKLLDAGRVVLGVDLLYQGEFLVEGSPLEKTPRVGNPREAAAYSFGYNPTVFAYRTHDVLSVIGYAKHREPGTRQIDLVGLAGAGHWAAAARARAADMIDRAAIDTAAFRFVQVPDIQHPDFLPGGARYGDLEGMLAVAAPKPLWLAGEDREPPLVGAAYRAAGAGERLVLFTSQKVEWSQAATLWLLRE